MDANIYKEVSTGYRARMTWKWSRSLYRDPGEQDSAAQMGYHYSIRSMGHQKGLRTNSRYLKEQSFLCGAETKSCVK